MVPWKEQKTYPACQARLKKTWNSPIYGFFHAEPNIEVVTGRRCHQFICLADRCKGQGHNRKTVRRYLDTSDAKSTSNLRKHAERCFGVEIVKKSVGSTVGAVREGVMQQRGNGTLPYAFDKIAGKGVARYSPQQLTKVEIQAAVVRWVSGRQRPFSIISDPKFLYLMKTGRPGFYVPSTLTVSRDVHKAYAVLRRRITSMLQVSYTFKNITL